MTTVPLAVLCAAAHKTANGTLLNADYLFRRLRLHRHAEVDSELLFRLASRLTNEDGRIDLDRLIEKIAIFRGQMSAILVSRRAPGTVLILKGDKPLSLWLHPKRRAVVYASDELHLSEALMGDPGWLPMEIPPMTLTVISHETIRDFTTKPFKFIIQARRSILSRGISI